jgi:DNA-binding GntR family transcriptional regulator
MKAIQKKTLHEEIANNLREMIMSAELREGDKIKENDLCDMMGISKTPLREALRVLSAEGLIRLIPNRGSYVTTPTFEEIKEIF